MEKNRPENRPMRDTNNPREPELEQQREGEVDEFEEEGGAVGQSQGRQGTAGRQTGGTQTESEEFKRRKEEVVEQGE